ncbi:type I-F CRISPR-associated endoribonuclease Cas6/Csy4 [Parashewanella curva]|uniref:Type I-F CRISPR-associated endoribonuclease Cas6/Csy4 n=1 Tax=Parashewanella curva TaxID=2338552 RepID=A0A3L8Q1A0_9GAMM|nr:type I-F CRISPR-associated endoribonuclease Cas6/Csy4 [Parashewanella curva]RLV60493.1 type I-F CRISPR-associated endoribonuclease Cas6/Csy4 [Parashewanella curva]
MRNRYYFMIKYLPENASNSLLAARCISVLHGVVSHNGQTNIGVTFPKWSDSSVGRQIGFVSNDYRNLESFRRNRYFNMMNEDGLFFVSGVEEVPNRIDEVQYVRNNGIAKYTLRERQRRIERCQKRAEKGGREYQPKLGYIEREFGSFHKLILTSKSKQTSFPLYIQKKSGVNHVNCDFGHYGLASNQVLMGTVPDLSFEH